MAKGKKNKQPATNHIATNVGYEAERDNYLHPALQAGFIDTTVPDNRKSRLQKYRLAEKGKRRFQ